MDQGAKEISKGPKSPEQVTQEKIRDILAGDLFIHFTRKEKVAGIVRWGLLSPEYAEKHVFPGMVLAEHPTKSLPDYVYFYQQRENPNKNSLFLTIYGNPGLDDQDNPRYERNIAIVISREGIEDEKASPHFPDSSTQDLQRMVRWEIPQKNIKGVVVVAGPKGDYSLSVIQEHVRDVIRQIQEISKENPELAVPVYDQDGNVLWPMKKTREEIFQSRKEGDEGVK